MTTKTLFVRVKPNTASQLDAGLYRVHYCTSTGPDQPMQIAVVNYPAIVFLGEDDIEYNDEEHRAETMSVLRSVFLHN